jgi:hypothetical protein
MVKIPPHGDNCMSLSGTGSSAITTRTATGASSFIAGYRVAVLVLLAPKLYFFFFSALDASFAHFLVVLDLGFRKFSVLPEDDVETKAEDAKRDED